MAGLKALGHYLDQFWFNRIPILLCEGPSPPNSMMSSFLHPETFISGFTYTKTLQTMWKYGNNFENDMFINLRFGKLKILIIMDKLWKRRAPGNDEDPSNKNIGNLAYEINIYQKHEM